MRPALLFIDPDAARRRGVSRGLSAQGYEVVPASEAAEGSRFAAALAPRVVVVAKELLPPSVVFSRPVIPAGLGSETSPKVPGAADPWEGADPREANVPLVSELQRLADGGCSVVVLVRGDAETAAVADQWIAFDVTGLSVDDLSMRLRLVLLGQEIGVSPDLELKSLVGDLALTPLLETVRALHEAYFTGRLDVGGAGRIGFVDGQVVGVEARKQIGLKAFCRLSRRTDGPFRLGLGEPSIKHNLDRDVPTLVMQALEDSQIPLPDPTLKVRVDQAAAPLGERASHQDLILDLVRECATVGEVIDSLPATDGKVVQALNLLVDNGVVCLEKAQIGVRIVTDSTADLPPELVRSHGIVVVPLSIRFGDDRLRDGIDIQPRDFYHLLRSSDEHPSTEPPPAAVFFEHFYSEIENQDILAIHISEKLSLTAANAREAALRGSRSFDHLPQKRHNFALEVMDSRNVSMATGLQALFAARMAHRGLKVFAIAQRLRKVQASIEILFVVDTLEYLERGGRIGKAQALVGKLLGIKPILGVVDGEVASVDRARGGRQAQLKIVKLLLQRLDPKRPIVMVVAHARAPVWADRLSTLIEAKFLVREKIVTDIGPVVGTHAGPGCVGCVVYQPEDEEWPWIAPLET